MTDKKKILVIEDDTDIREIFCDILETSGFTTVGAANGQEALDALQTLDPLPIVIFLDLMMPIMDGWEFLDHKERDPRIVGIPVYVFSAAMNKPAPSRIAGFLKKPIELNELLKIVSRLNTA